MFSAFVFLSIFLSDASVTTHCSSMDKSISPDSDWAHDKDDDLSKGVEKLNVGEAPPPAQGKRENHFCAGV